MRVPNGFSFSGIHAGIKPNRKDLALVVSDTPCAADFALYPWYGYCKRIAFRKPESRLMEVVPAPIREWAGRVEALSYFDKTYPPHWR